MVSRFTVSGWMRMVQDHGIDVTVINDVFDFAVESELFKREKAHDSDLGTSEESYEFFEWDKKFIEQENRAHNIKQLDIPSNPRFAEKEPGDEIGHTEMTQLRTG